MVTFKERGGMEEGRETEMTAWRRKNTICGNEKIGMNHKCIQKIKALAHGDRLQRWRRGRSVAILSDSE
jgi:hypothetical protein